MRRWLVTLVVVIVVGLLVGGVPAFAKGGPGKKPPPVIEVILLCTDRVLSAVVNWENGPGGTGRIELHVYGPHPVDSSYHEHHPTRHLRREPDGTWADPLDNLDPQSHSGEWWATVDLIRDRGKTFTWIARGEAEVQCP